MIQINRVAAYLALLLTAGSLGCVSTRYEANYELLQPCPSTEIPPWQRQKVHLFLMNGRNVLENGGFLGLRDQLAVAGYPKVYTAQRPDREWYRYEMRRVVRDDPNARLILASYGASADIVSALAFEAARDGLPVDAVVFLDAVGIGGNLAETLPYHTVVVRSHNWRGSPALSVREHVQVQGYGHFSLPHCPATPELLLRLMSQSATLVPEETLDHLPRLPLRDKPEPTPRPNPVVTDTPGWDFLGGTGPFPTLPGDGCCKTRWCYTDPERIRPMCGCSPSAAAPCTLTTPVLFPEARGTP